MKALEKSDKDAIKLRFAVGLSKLLEKSDIKSWKKLAKEAGMEPSHIQKIAAGKVDVALTTNISLAAAFGITYPELAETYEHVTEKDIQEFLEKAEAQKKLKGKSKHPLSSPIKKKRI
ncbi:helix-turn-helix transcriptional regulator [Flavitalea sp. BT771]|uniref:helix-turn-helix domain-containing protein n=1 Tax=Flavitalea sp. BT771 TaxID=3063329 RepID=UPI0026E40932|nr:helix-turn-helix transcriptional regulator [Flavitalea sp. BT771]MDO6434805.1 helix-turn-helix transcriptional regulator [Flavitalea sp. BT771]MDV6223705.1 helix-turn-helix transcriptional regulator [Flavitalea sp. BT771]